MLRCAPLCGNFTFKNTWHVKPSTEPADGPRLLPHPLRRGVAMAESPLFAQSFAHPRLIPVIRMGAPFNASSALDTKGSSSRIVLFVRGVHSRFPSTVCRTRYEFFMIFSIPNSTQDSGVQ
jgi:hypothetical protein